MRSQEPSAAQMARQAARSGGDGRYVPMHRCEFCGRPLGESYYSAPDCNETGRGVCLCKRCCRAAEAAR